MIHSNKDNTLATCVDRAFIAMFRISSSTIFRCFSRTCDSKASEWPWAFKQGLQQNALTYPEVLTCRRDKKIFIPCRHVTHFDFF